MRLLGFKDFIRSNLLHMYKIQLYIIHMQYFFAFSISIFNIQLNFVRFVCGQTELINIPLLWGWEGKLYCEMILFSNGNWGVEISRRLKLLALLSWKSTCVHVYSIHRRIIWKGRKKLNRSTFILLRQKV